MLQWELPRPLRLLAGLCKTTVGPCALPTVNRRLRFHRGTSKDCLVGDGYIHAMNPEQYSSLTFCCCVNCLQHTSSWHQSPSDFFKHFSCINEIGLNCVQEKRKLCHLIFYYCSLLRGKKKICLQYSCYNPQDMYICTWHISILYPRLYAYKLVTLKKHLFPHLTHYHSNVSAKKDLFFGCAWLHLALEICRH